MAVGRRNKQKSGRRTVRSLIGVVPISIVVACSAVATASPVLDVVAPSQPGVTTPGQPGAGTPQSQPGITAVAPTPAQDEAGVAPASDYNAPTRPVPKRNYVAPLRTDKLHAPVPTPQVAPIAPPPDVLRVGDIQTPRPEFLSKRDTDAFNAVPAGWEAQISTTARSMGVAPSRADSVASAAVAGAAGAVASYVGWLAAVCVGTAGFACVAWVVGAPISVPVILLMGTGSALAGGAMGAGVGGLR